MTTTDLDRWAADQAAYGSPDYIRGYRDGIADAVAAAKDLDVLEDRTWWNERGHLAVIRLLHGLDIATGTAAVITYMAYAAKWWPKGCDYGLLARAAESTLTIRRMEIQGLRHARHLARAQYLTEHGAVW